MNATPEEQPCSVELLLQEVLAMLVLESGSLGLPAAAEGGGVREEMGLPFSNLMSGERGLQSVDVGDASAGWTTAWFLSATRAAAAASLDWIPLGGAMLCWKYG